ncbi:MAG TPA: hypothetical protein VFY16_10520, partial [Gemmatimonadaceae bacterium]|nr:hypothetical protein [Gemmatimonadaceae bacterium]
MSEWTVRAAGAAADADPATLLGLLDTEAVRAWLAERRWFAAKGERLAGVAMRAAVSVDAAGVRAVVAEMAVELASGRVERYQVPLVLRTLAAGEAVPAGALARVEGEGWTGALLDALDDEGFRQLVARGLADGAAYDAIGRLRWMLEPEPGAALHGLDALPSVVGSAEQSNSSVRYGDRAILKLFRLLEGGEHPDVEMVRFLGAVANFPHVPRLLATMRWEEETGTTVAGMLQAFVPGATDGWTIALDSARAFLRAGDVDAPVSFVPAARALGEVTRRLHDALASDPGNPAFAPVMASGDDVTEWASAVRRTMLEATDLLAERRRAGALAPPLVPIADAVARRRGELLADLDAIVAAVGHIPGERIRHHGDLHLGQVLRGGDGRWYVIDFEGEPRRTLAERRARHSALRDVAGMARSFSYAALVAARDVGG